LLTFARISKFKHGIQMTKNLVIVESPAKAKTIGGFLGKDFTVKSCMGHVADLSKKDLGVDIEKWIYSEYIISPDKKKDRFRADEYCQGCGVGLAGV